ncbi:transporter substrate-binding protein [Pseudomonas sp. NPDC007930]|uniref:transporter substrate-binding domain-containing protein n=1 Tax=Pseudomonas sp. NPDC007930 TaxID=3364417 RepID=UPI0036E152A2
MPTVTQAPGHAIGLLFSRRSMTGAVETTQAQAALLAIDEINQHGGVLGRPLEALLPDIGPSPDHYRQAALQLCDEHKVQALFGTHMSSTRKAVLPVIESRRVPLFYPTLYEGFEYSPLCWYTGATPNQNALPLARYVMAQHGKRVLFIGVPYVYPVESNRVMRELFEQAGGEVLDEIYLPFGASAEQYRQVMARVAALAPDAIYSTVVGADIPTLYGAYHEAGLSPQRMPIISLSTNEAEVALMPPAHAAGHLCAAPWFDTVETPASQAFVARYRARHGAAAPITAAAEAAYFQVHLYAQALAVAGGSEPNALREALAQVRLQAPQGLVQLDGETHHCWLWPRVARLDADGRFVIVEQAAQAQRPCPYLLDYQLGGSQ